MSFRLTYATMFDPPEEMHTRFEEALATIEARLGAGGALLIDGADREGARRVAKFSPIDHDLHLGDFSIAGAADVEAAMDAAARAFPGWRATPFTERARMLRRVANVLEARVYELAAALTLEVGKNRMEALGEAQETVDFFNAYADDLERSDGYDHVLPDDPLPGVVSHNRSVMRPYGPWVVIAPFNYPLALAGGPTAAALATGNTVVLKGSPETPWAGRLLADALRAAGLPDGAFNYLSGSGSEVGVALVAHPLTGGVTFTGSAAAGMSIARRLADGAYPKPCIAEMGGKNPCIVTQHADLEAAATGIARSAYGMGGQKCSALSRLYVHEAVADDLIARLADKARAIAIGDPRRREVWLGPLIHQRAFDGYERYARELTSGGGRVVFGGAQLTGNGLAGGYYVEPMLAEAPTDHLLWKHEMFAPVLMLHRAPDRETAMRLANDTSLGLAAGVYGSSDDVAWFHDNIEAGVTYANRAQGATTGAWPGYQPFAGWKGSSSTGKAIASFHYLPQYMREQSRTVVV